MPHHPPQCVASCRCYITMGHPTEFPKLRKKDMCLITTTYIFPSMFPLRQWKKRKFTVQKIRTSFFAVHRKTWCRFRLEKNPAKRSSTINIERTAKKWKSEKCYVLENQSVANSCTKKKLKMLLQRSLKGKKLKLNKNGKTTVITSTVELLFAVWFIHKLAESARSAALRSAEHALIS